MHCWDRPERHDKCRPANMLLGMGEHIARFRPVKPTFSCTAAGVVLMISQQQHRWCSHVGQASISSWVKLDRLVTNGTGISSVVMPTMLVVLKREVIGCKT